MTVDAYPSHDLLKYAALILGAMLILLWLLGLAHHHAAPMAQPHSIPAAPSPHPAPAALLFIDLVTKREALACYGVRVRLAGVA